METEVASSKRGDQRLKKRLAIMLEALSRDPERTVPVACRGWSETFASYRFLHNDRIGFTGSIEGHREATIERARQETVLPVVQDTTTLTFGRQHPVNLGTLPSVDRARAHLHTRVVFNAERVNLGVLHADCWQREKCLSESERRRPERRALADRESYRWLSHDEHARRLQAVAPEAAAVSVADRDRRTMNAADEWGFLWEELGEAPNLGAMTVLTPRRGHEAPRPAHIALKAKPVSVYAVYAEEIKAPKGKAPIEWMLLTSLPVEHFEQAQTMVGRYRQRTKTRQRTRQPTDMDWVSAIDQLYRSGRGDGLWLIESCV